MLKYNTGRLTAPLGAATATGRTPLACGGASAASGGCTAPATGPSLRLLNDFLLADIPYHIMRVLFRAQE